MKKIDISERLIFLAKSFDVFEIGVDNAGVDEKIKSLVDNGYTYSIIEGRVGAVVAISSIKFNHKNRGIKKVSISSNVFGDIISSDPTENKIYIQWMLTIFSRLIKEGDTNSAIRFIEEDLPQANNYLTLFDDNKRKNKFKLLVKNNGNPLKLSNPSDINQYKSLSELFDSVDPFIVKEPTSVERILDRFVTSNQALIPVKDRNFTLYIPKTSDASVIFNDFVNWCTAKEKNGMFNNYRNDYKKPNGKKSDLYIIINNKFFTGESDEMYQIHFESNQLKNRKNDNTNKNIFENVISRSKALSDFFYDELFTMAKENVKSFDKNIYIDYLVRFGFSEVIFDILDVDTPEIRFMTRTIPRLPDISRFKNLDQLIIINAGLSEIHPSIGELDKLEMVVLTNNNIKELPKEIGNLKNLTFLNLVGNKVVEFPDEIGYLDKLNGGSLHRIGVKKEDIGLDNYKKLKELLPTTIID